MEFVKLVGPFAIFFIMYSLGLKLSFINFYELLKKPKNLILGLICQLIFLPIIGLVIVSFYPMPNELKIGILLLLLLPSATMSNYASRLVDGNISLSIAITTICSLLCIITIPIGMKVLFELIMHQPIKNFDVNGIGEDKREGIVHRLDKVTSGLIICPINLDAFNQLQDGFKKRKIKLPTNGTIFKYIWNCYFNYP